MFTTELVRWCADGESPPTTTAQLAFSAWPAAKVLLDAMVVKGTRRKQVQLLSSL